MDGDGDGYGDVFVVSYDLIAVVIDFPFVIGDGRGFSGWDDVVVDVIANVVVFLGGGGVWGNHSGGCCC